MPAEIKLIFGPAAPALDSLPYNRSIGPTHRPLLKQAPRGSQHWEEIFDIFIATSVSSPQFKAFRVEDFGRDEHAAQ